MLQTTARPLLRHVAVIGARTRDRTRHRVLPAERAAGVEGHADRHPPGGGRRGTGAAARLRRQGRGARQARCAGCANPARGSERQHRPASFSSMDTIWQLSLMI